MNAADRIIDLIKKRGFTQRSFAAELGIRPQAITEWKQGTTTSYTDRLPEIAKILETTVDYILTGDKPLYQASFDTQPQETFDKLFDSADVGAQLMLKHLKSHIESSTAPAYRQVDAPLTMRLRAEVFQISDEQADCGEQQSLDPGQLRLLNAITDALAELNAEGQEKLVDYAADLVASGRYIKSDSSGLGQKKA